MRIYRLGVVKDMEDLKKFAQNDLPDLDYIMVGPALLPVPSNVRVVQECGYIYEYTLDDLVRIVEKLTTETANFLFLFEKVLATLDAKDLKDPE